MEYNESETAVVVVDIQNDFCHPDGALYAEQSEEAIEGVNEVLDRVDARQNYFTQDTHEEGDPEFEQWGEHCIDGTWGHELHDNLDIVQPSDLIKKSTYDAFHETSFDRALTLNRIETLIICGTLVNVCVQETASSAALNGYDVYVVEDAVGYLDNAQKAAALDHIDFLIGDVVSVEDL